MAEEDEEISKLHNEAKSRYPRACHFPRRPLDDHRHRLSTVGQGGRITIAT